MNDRLKMCKKRFLRGAMAVVVLACIGCTGVFFHPERGLRSDPGLAALDPEIVTVPSTDGVRLVGWRFEPVDAEPVGYVLFLHGNAENISTHSRGVSWLGAAGYVLLAVDYRGYGLSTGETDVDGVHDDATAMLAFAVDDANRRGLPLFVLGQSLGGVLAIDAVAAWPNRKDVAGLIVDSAFSSYRGIAREKLASAWLTWPFSIPASLLVTDEYRAVDTIAAVSPIPLLVLHGRFDRVVPASHGVKIYDAAKEPKTLMLTDVPGHIGSLRSADVREAVKKWMKEIRD